MTLRRRSGRVSGRVQGVGFRPFVRNLATTSALVGWVRNVGDAVELEVEGEPAALDAFDAALRRAPSPARVDEVSWRELAPKHEVEFSIHASLETERRAPVVPPDLAPCEACRAELDDPDARRNGYAFTSCTRCGPRASTIVALPFDRERTTFAGFPLCDACAAERDDTCDRRFHAQVLACPRCGPRPTLRDRDGHPLEADDLFAFAAARLHEGATLGLRGVGGWQLLCDARSSEAVRRVRARKHRPRQPLAVLVADVAAARALVTLDDDEADALRSPEAPVLLCRPNVSTLAPEVAPDVPRLGVLLPSSPLHLLVARAFGGPLVCTSANVHGDPTPIGDVKPLLGLADVFLDHDRPLARRLDDSVAHHVAGRLRTLRLGRGLAPLGLPFSSRRPLLATGAHLASAPAACDGRHAFVSAHVGDLESPATRGAQRHAEDDLLALHRIEPRAVATDAHPDLACLAAAERRGLPVHRIWHHHAHVAAVMAEHGLDTAHGYAFDGFGLTPHGAGGGEALRVTPRGARFVGGLAPFPLLGVDRAAREGRRALVGVAHAAGHDPRELATFDAKLAAHAARGTPSTSVGRLFDAVAAALGLVECSSYEGEAACALEAVALAGLPPYPFDVTPERLDWRPAWAPLWRDRDDPPRAAGRFHATLAAMVAAHAREWRASSVVLAGGCFQNVLLAERCVAALADVGAKTYLAERLPPGDGGIALGQLRVAAWSEEGAATALR
ncbi:MAG: carbamoyltransferase HypF [Sandaracinus sp.]|nr:carbamoyltransferase HypF [Sandaracinus sp.]